MTELRAHELSLISRGLKPQGYQPLGSNPRWKLQNLFLGMVHTEMMRSTIENYNELISEDKNCCFNYGPINRPAKSEEIANVVYFICSDDASFINGENIVVDGGKTSI